MGWQKFCKQPRRAVLLLILQSDPKLILATCCMSELIVGDDVNVALRAIQKDSALPPLVDISVRGCSYIGTRIAFGTTVHNWGDYT